MTCAQPAFTSWLHQVNSLTVKSAAHDVDIGKKLGSEGSGGRFSQKTGSTRMYREKHENIWKWNGFPSTRVPFKMNDSFVFFPIFFFRSCFIFKTDISWNFLVCTIGHFWDFQVFLEIRGLAVVFSDSAPMISKAVPQCFQTHAVTRKDSTLAEDDVDCHVAGGYRFIEATPTIIKS